MENFVGSLLMIVMVGQNSPSASVQATQNWEKWMIYQMVCSEKPGQPEKWADKNFMKFY